MYRIKGKLEYQADKHTPKQVKIDDVVFGEEDKDWQAYVQEFFSDYEGKNVLAGDITVWHEKRFPSPYCAFASRSRQEAAYELQDGNYVPSSKPVLGKKVAIGFIGLNTTCALNLYL